MPGRQLCWNRAPPPEGRTRSGYSNAGAWNRGDAGAGVPVHSTEGLFLVLELKVVDAPVEAVVADEVAVAASFDDLTVVEDDDFIRSHDGAQALGDHEGGATLHEIRQGL